MTDKIELTDVTFCIPIRIDSAFRLRNLAALLDYYSSVLHTRFLLFEADHRQKFTSIPSIPGLNYRFILDTNPIFHRTRYINEMLAEVRTQVAAVWDIDAIAPVEQIVKAYQTIKSQQCVMAYPYDGRFWRINEFFSSLFARKRDIRLLTHYEMPRSLMSGYHSVGGAFLVDVERYKSCGWENEYFIGWGPEDCERYKRLHILGKTPLRVSGSLYHLYHTRGVNSGDFDQTVILSTKREYGKVCGMMPAELKSYIATWEWLKEKEEAL